MFILTIEEDLSLGCDESEFLGSKSCTAIYRTDAIGIAEM